MADSLPAKLKAAQITPFVQRATQLEPYKPFITYWLRFYIIQKIIGAGLHTADSECTNYTANLMDQLEQTKAANPDEDALHDETAAQAYCEQFALTTFAKGEKDMTANNVTKGTADTLLAAATFLEILTIWKKDPEPEIKSKQKFAKYHAARILKAIRSGEDPNLSNPVHEPPAMTSPSVLDPNDPEVQNLDQNGGDTPLQNPFQSYVRSMPDTPAHPSPTTSAPKVSPPPILPSAPTNYSSHRDVSPISQPDNTSRHGSVVSEGGGYFPRTNVPTFTADTAAPNLPTAPSIEDEPMGGNPFDPSSLASSLPTGAQAPQAPEAPSPQDFYQNTTSPAPAEQPRNQAPPPQAPFQSSPNPYATPPQSQPPAFQQSHQPQFNNSFAPQQPQYAPPPQQYTQPLQSAQGQSSLRTDEEAQMAAAKHAKWAISALNFEDVNTAVKELRLALQSLGAN